MQEHYQEVIDMDYKPTGVCSRLIHVELDGDKIANVEFVGGCAGNTSGISSLVKGMDAHEVIKRLEGTRCGERRTSCADKKGYSSPNRETCILFHFGDFLFLVFFSLFFHTLLFPCQNFR